MALKNLGSRKAMPFKRGKKRRAKIVAAKRAVKKAKGLY